MSSPGTRWVWIPAAAIAVAGVLLIAPHIVHRGKLPVPDEKVVGVALLARQQEEHSGYFHAAQTEPGPFDEGGPWIAASDARSQVERVVYERHFQAEQAQKVQELIAQLAEPHPSRTVGGERIPLVRLNLALDQIP